MLLFPNPADNELQIELPVPGDYEFRIFDRNGALVIQQSSGAIALIDISALSAGLYFVEAAGEFFFSGTFVRQ